MAIYSNKTNLTSGSFTRQWREIERSSFWREADTMWAGTHSLDSLARRAYQSILTEGLINNAHI